MASNKPDYQSTWYQRNKERISRKYILKTGNQVKLSTTEKRMRQENKDKESHRITLLSDCDKDYNYSNEGEIL